jgi:hypothetical protein
MHVRATLVLTGTRSRENNFSKKYKNKKVTKYYISSMRGGTLIQPISVEVCTHVNVGGCMLRGLVYAKGRI